MSNIFNECQKFVKEKSEAIGMFAFVWDTQPDPVVVPPNQYIKRLTKKDSFPSNASTTNPQKPVLSKSQGKLQPINKEMGSTRYRQFPDLQCASVGGLQSRLAVWRKQPVKKLTSGDAKKRIDEVKLDTKPIQTHQNKKMENFQNSMIPRKPQQSCLDDLENPSPYDGSWANHILKGFFKVQVKKKKDHKWVVQRFKEEDQVACMIVEDQTQKAIRYQEALFRSTSSKIHRKESVPKNITLNKRLDEYMNETGVQRSNPSLQSYISKKVKYRKSKDYNFLAQQFVQAAFEEPTLMPIFDLNFEKNYAARIYIATQKGQLGMIFAQ